MELLYIILVLIGTHLVTGLLVAIAYNIYFGDKMADELELHLEFQDCSRKHIKVLVFISVWLAWPLYVEDFIEF